MSVQRAPNDLVLYHYHLSPYAHRVVWYLQLRRIAYAECLVDNKLPRPALAGLNVEYRRIPVLAHGRDIYCDTRLILPTLDRLVPPSADHPSIEPKTIEGKALAKLLIRWHGEGGLFAHGAGCFPADLPALKDEAWVNDRIQLGMPKSFFNDRENGRLVSLVQVRDYFIFLERTLLSDGREWAEKDAESPGLLDIEAAWLVHWLSRIPGALGEYITAIQYPRTFAYIARFGKAVGQARKATSTPVKLTDTASIATVLSMNLDASLNEVVDKADPLALNTGDVVEMWPADSGIRNRDSGKLVKLDAHEAVIQKSSQGKDIRVHHPRWGFRVVRKATSARM